MVKHKSKDELEKFVEALEQVLPPVFPRHRLTELSGGLINARTITNRMSLGSGPPGVRVGKTVGFSRESFMKWLRRELS